MKKISFILAFLLIFAIGSKAKSMPASGSNFEQKLKTDNCLNLIKKQAYFFSKRIHYTLVTSDGYTVVVDGVVSWSALNPFHFSFNGTVGITGNGVNITLSINNSFLNSDYGSVTIYSDDEGTTATGADWDTTNASASGILNASDNNTQFISSVNN